MSFRYFLVQLVAVLVQKILLDGLLRRLYNPVFRNTVRGIVAHFYAPVAVFGRVRQYLNYKIRERETVICSSVNWSAISFLKKQISGS